MSAEGSVPAPRRRTGQIVAGVLSLLVLAAVFVFLLPRFADYGAAIDQISAMAPVWIVALVAASLVNIAIYPFTEIAAIPGLPYRAAFMSRQAAFTISNVVPGGGAVAVATQYAILSGYRVPAARAAAAVSADGAWTYLLTLAAPSIALGLLLIEGDSVAGFRLAAVIGLVVVVASVVAISVVLRSESGAVRIGRWLQAPADRLFALLHRPAPDVTGPVLQFHENAAEMVGERWRSLTVTNVAAQFAPILVLAAALAGLGVLPAPVTPIECFAAYSVALLLTMFPLTPGGLGTVDAALIALLVGFGADASVALAADLVWRLVWFLPQLVVGLVALGIYRWDRRRERRGSGAGPGADEGSQR